MTVVAAWLIKLTDNAVKKLSEYKVHLNIPLLTRGTGGWGRE